VPSRNGGGGINDLKISLDGSAGCRLLQVVTSECDATVGWHVRTGISTGDEASPERSPGQDAQAGRPTKG
jgi:hypothetical protein